MFAQAKAFVASIYGAIILALLAALMVQTVRIEGFKIWPLSIAGYRAKLANEREVRAADRREYEQGQAKAQAKNREQVQRIEAEQEKVNEERTRDLNSRLERLRRELRAKTPAAKGSPGSPGASPNVQAPGGADGAAGLCLTPEELLRAAENEERHDQLITLIEEQSKIQR